MGGFTKWLRQELPVQKFNASFAGAHVVGHEFRYVADAADGGKVTKTGTKGLTASVVTGAQVNDYVSRGAVGGGAVVGAVLLGPLGAVAGGLLGSTKRVGGTQIYVVVERDGVAIKTIEASAREESDARKFIEALAGSAADQD